MSADRPEQPSASAFAAPAAARYEDAGAVGTWAVMQARTAGRTGTVPLPSGVGSRVASGSAAAAAAPGPADAAGHGSGREANQATAGAGAGIPAIAQALATECTPSPLAAATGGAALAHQVYAVVSAARPGGRLLVATGCADHTARIWDADTGALLHALAGHSSRVFAVAWAASGDTLLLVTGCADEIVRVWDGAGGVLIHSLPGHVGGVRSVAAVAVAGGGVLIACGGYDGAIRIWDGVAGTLLHTLTAHGETVNCLALAQTPDRRILLASGGWDAAGRIWDAETGTLLRTLTDHEGGVMGVAWAVHASGSPALATVDEDGVVRIWDGASGALLEAVQDEEGIAKCAAWAVLPDGRILLAVGNADGTAVLRDVGGTALGAPVRLLPGTGDTVRLDLAVLDDGRITLASAGSNLIGQTVTGPTPLRIHDITVPALDRPRGAAAPADGADRRAVTRLGAAADGLVLLGAAGGWLPLGLVDDLTTLTGRGAETTGLHCPELRPLLNHPGIRLLRTLDWPAPARCALAALLAADLDRDPGLAAPPAPAASLGAALRRTIATSRTSARTPQVDAGRVASVADSIDERTLSLLAVIGPETAAADPALIPRVIHLRDAMPALPPESRALIQGAENAARAAKTAVHSRHQVFRPHSADTARHGQPSRLLLTEHALEPTVFEYRYSRQLLLYRRRVAPVAPAPVPITLILDTSPATFGAVERLLRTAAHLLTTTLWRADRHPALITLDRPDEVTRLDRPGSLLALWTTRTLEPPDLAAAWATALSAGHPTLLLTQHHLPADLGLTASARAQILTTHPPGHPPLRRTGSPWHRHLPPDCRPGPLTDALQDILSASAQQDQISNR